MFLDPEIGSTLLETLVGNFVSTMLPPPYLLICGYFGNDDFLARKLEMIIRKKYVLSYSIAI